MFTPDNDFFHPEDIIDICRGLVSLSLHQAYGFRYDDKQGSFSHSFTVQIAQLAHFSVKEYLLSPHSGSWFVDQMLSEVTILKSAISCYLHFLAPDVIHSVSSFAKRIPQDQQYSVAQYFVTYFSNHLAPVKEHPDLLPSLRLLLHPKSTLFHYRQGWHLMSPYDALSIHRSQDPALNLLFAAHWRLPQICQHLFWMNICPNLAHPTIWSPRTVGSRLTPLVEAVRCGDMEMMQILLDARSDHLYSGADPLADGHALEEAAI
jgi:hypothetical protein